MRNRNVLTSNLLKEMYNIFDVDYTLIKKPSAWHFIREALAQKVISISSIRKLPFEWLRYKMGFPNKDFIEEAVKHLAGLEKNALKEVAETCFKQRMKADIYADAVQLIKNLQQRGEPVFIATSSLDILIQPLERFLGINESIASTLEFSQEKATGRIAGAGIFGENKKTAVGEWLTKHRIDPQNVCFYSDSYTDIPLLEYCGRAIAVNPDRFLHREAKKRGWQIMRFRKTLAQIPPGEQKG